MAHRKPRFPAPSHTRHRHKRLSDANDTLVSNAMLTASVEEILKHTRLDRDHDIPYLAGYSVDGRSIYIDRDLPRSFVSRGKRVYVDRFLILHEAVEKALLARLRLHYQHAHQIALRAEEAAVRAAGVSWRDYDRFMQRFIKEAGDEGVAHIPRDLDVKPYRDEHDFKLLRRMQIAMKRGGAHRRPRGRGSLD